MKQIAALTPTPPLVLYYVCVVVREECVVNAVHLRWSALSTVRDFRLTSILYLSPIASFIIFLEVVLLGFLKKIVDIAVSYGCSQIMHESCKFHSLFT